MLIDFTTLISFLSVSILITLMPGPDNLFVLALGISKGPRSAVPLALGLACGNFFHTAAVALGISALIIASPNALLALKWAGCTYLLWIAYQIASETPARPQQETDNQAHIGALEHHFFFRGLLMNLLNPKVILFFLAFLPQFISPNRPSPTGQIIVLGSIFVIQTAILFSAIALLAGRINRLLTSSPVIQTRLKYVTASLLILLAFNLLLANFKPA